MGVKGLTSYVKSVSRTVSDEVTLPVPNASPSPPGPLVIDGWAWIYTAYLSHFSDSVRGGDYAGFSRYLSSVVSALREADLNPIFVFDGPYLPLKLPTVLDRANSTASLNSAFMRSTSRASARFQVQMGVLPPLLYDCTLETLRKEAVETVIAESEADSAVAETAERMQGWAVSNDSDFFIFCARGSGCRGYVPIETIMFLVKLPLEEEAPLDTAAQPRPPAQDEDDGFAQVGKRGKARGKANRSLGSATAASAAVASRSLPEETVLPRPPQGPDEGKLVGIRFTSYSAIKLAALLDIPPGMFPLFAAIVGNDYSSSIQTKILGQALPSGAERIARVATILKEERQRIASGRSTPATAAARSGASTPLPRKGPIRFPSRSLESSFSSASSTTATPTRGGPHPAPDLAFPPADPVRDMVQGVVDRLLSRPENTALARYVSSGEKDAVVDSIIESVCTYSLLTLSSAPHLSSPSAKFFTRSSTSLNDETRLSILREYQARYATGHFDKALVETLTQRIFLCKQFAEDPDLRSVQVTHARELRKWVWAVLFQVWGMDWARDSMEEPEAEAGASNGEEEEAHGATRQTKLFGKGKSWIDEAGDDDELVPVQTPPSSVDGSSVASSEAEDEEDDEVDMEDLPSRPGSAAGDAEEEADEGVKPPPAVQEYARKGDRLAGELCPILGLQDLLTSSQEQQEDGSQQILAVPLPSLLSPVPTGPIASTPLQTRLSLYHYVHHLATPPPSELSRYTPLLATLRYLIVSERRRLGESFIKSNWSKLEVVAAVLGATRISSYDESPAVPPSTRSIHLHTSLQLTMLSSFHMAQSLLLVPEPLCLTPSQLVNGELFHRTVLSLPQSTALERCEATLNEVERRMVGYVVADGVDRMLSIDVEAIRRERREAKRRERKEERSRKEAESRDERGKVESRRRGNAFAFLDGDEDESDEDRGEGEEANESDAEDDEESG